MKHLRKESPRRSLLGGQQNTVTLVIISNTLTSEGGPEEAPSLSFSDVSRINLCHTFWVPVRSTSSIPATPLPAILPTMFPLWALSALLTSALPILSNQKSSHNLESQTIVFLLVCSIAPGKYLFILYLAAFLFQALRSQDLVKP